MEAMKKMLAQTAAQLKSNEEEAKVSKAELMKVRARRLKAGQESELAKAKMLTHSNEGEAVKLIMAGQDQEMGDVRNKREREENNEEQGRSKRAVTPVPGSQQGQEAEEKEPSNEKQTDEEGDMKMNEEL
jgi:hypothetical protein